MTTDTADRADAAHGMSEGGSGEPMHGAVAERRAGVGWLMWLLPVLLCLPCVLVSVGGAAAIAVGVAGAAGAITNNLALSLLLGGFVLTVGAATGIIVLRRRAARACRTGECTPARVSRIPESLR